MGFTIDGSKCLVDNTNIKLVGRYKLFCYIGCNFPWAFFLLGVPSPIVGSSFALVACFPLNYLVLSSSRKEIVIAIQLTNKQKKIPKHSSSSIYFALLV